MINKSED